MISPMPYSAACNFIATGNTTTQNPLGLAPSYVNADGSPNIVALNEGTLKVLDQVVAAKAKSLITWDCECKRADLETYVGDPSVAAFIHPMLRDFVAYRVAMCSTMGIRPGFCVRASLLVPAPAMPDAGLLVMPGTYSPFTKSMVHQCVEPGSMQTLIGKIQRFRSMFSIPEFWGVDWYVDSPDEVFPPAGLIDAGVCNAAAAKFPNDRFYWEHPASVNGALNMPIYVDPTNAESWGNFTANVNPSGGYLIKDSVLTSAQRPVAQAAYGKTAIQLLQF
jgi:hypothetical protein